MNADLAQSKRFILTLGLLTATAALTVDLSLPAIPVMVDALATTLPRAQKIVGIFMIGMACGQIPAGLFSDRLGRLPTLYVGLVIFAGAGAVAAATGAAHCHSGLVSPMTPSRILKASVVETSGGRPLPFSALRAARLPAPSRAH